MRQEVKRSVPKARSRREAMRYGSHASTEQERRSGLRSGSAPGGQALPAPRPASPGSPGQGTPAGAAPADTGKCAEPGGVCGPGSRRHGDDEP